MRAYFNIQRVFLFINSQSSCVGNMLKMLKFVIKIFRINSIKNDQIPLAQICIKLQGLDFVFPSIGIVSFKSIKLEL